jgi:predicted O-methyltransferase YrrM
LSGITVGPGSLPKPKIDLARRLVAVVPMARPLLIAIERFVARVIAALLPASLMRDKRLFDIWEAHGYHVLPAHFYEPVPAKTDIERVVGARSTLPGLDLVPDRQLALLDQLRLWRHEYDALPRTADESDDGFYLDNNFFGSVDAEVLYALIRTVRPARVFEIGSGFSTSISARACRANLIDTGHPCELVAIEPYPAEALADVEGLSRLLRERVQDVPLELFAELEAGDILFIDSSHAVVTGGDVCWELLEIVPRIAPGVFVHVHDVFLPAEYPQKWLKEDHYFWTEQYLLQALLAFNLAYEVVWAGHFMHLEHPEALRGAFASYRRTPAAPGSFWFRRTP